MTHSTRIMPIWLVGGPSSLPRSSSKEGVNVEMVCRAQLMSRGWARIQEMRASPPSSSPIDSLFQRKVKRTVLNSALLSKCLFVITLSTQSKAEHDIVINNEKQYMKYAMLCLSRSVFHHNERKQGIIGNQMVKHQQKTWGYLHKAVPSLFPRSYRISLLAVSVDYNTIGFF